MTEIDLGWFDRGVAVAVIMFFMVGLIWLVRRYFGAGGIAEQRAKAVGELAESISNLTKTCHDCRDEQADYYRGFQTQLARVLDQLEGQG